MKKQQNNLYSNLANFVYETAIHSKAPRSGFWFLGTGEQSVAEHLFHTAMITYILASIEPKVDKNKAVLMALFHDLGEGRTSDHNHVHQRYGHLSEDDAIRDISATLPFGQEIFDLYKEEQQRVTLEAKIVKDADQIEWISTLFSEYTKGNKKALDWIKIAMKRLKTQSGKKLAKTLIQKHPDSWWYNQDDKWFINRDSKFKNWKNNK